MKIDVEGFELEVLRGAKKLLAEDNLKAIIIELNGSGKRYGVSDNDIHEILISNNFFPYEYLPFERKLIKKESYGTHNIIYISDLPYVEKRINSAPKIKIFNMEY